MVKVADFKTYTLLRSMSFNQFNRWVESVYATAYADGYSKGTEELGENPVILGEDEFFNLLLTVPGIGNKKAAMIVQTILERSEQHVQTETDSRNG